MLNRIIEAVKKLPLAVPVYILEIGTEEMKVTIPVGEALREHRPFCVLFSIDDYQGDASKLHDRQRAMRVKYEIHGNVALFDQSKEYFLKNNTTNFGLIIAHNGIDAIPFKKFLTDNGDTLIISSAEVVLYETSNKDA